MPQTIAWDHERMDEIISKIESCIEALEDQQQTIETLKENVNDDWVSEAGRAYSQRMEEDLAQLRKILGQFKEAKKDLNEAKKTYSSGEASLRTKLNSLYSSLS